MTVQGKASKGAPFDTARLDALMESAGIDVLLVNSKHNVSYLLGGYRFFFFDFMDAIGVSRYLPIVVYIRGRPEATSYVANAMEAYERQLGQFWVPDVRTKCWGVADAVREAMSVIDAAGMRSPRIGVELSFLPADGYMLLAGHYGPDRIVDALVPLERLRAVKTPAERALLREASDKVIASMQAVIASAGPGITTRELAHRLKVEETSRGLSFEYCLVTAGTGFNRAPSDQTWERGQIASLDSGGNYRGYIGDVCRMAIMGEPDDELQDLLGTIEEIQQAARRPVRPGTLGRDVIAAGAGLLAKSPHRGYTAFVAHGMGLISHEAPRLMSDGNVPYDGVDGDRPLHEGMILSIETTMQHPVRGFIKLEDTVAVTATGWEGYGDTARGWNRAGG